MKCPHHRRAINTVGRKKQNKGADVAVSAAKPNSKPAAEVKAKYRRIKRVYQETKEE